MTVYWAFETIEGILKQDSLAGQASQLGNDEQNYLDLLRFKKRREEWLAGRLALKRLLQKVITDLSSLELDQIQILKAESGAPFIQVEGKVYPKVSISISHSNGFVLCGVSQQIFRLGVDLERVENRSESFMGDFFTQKEVEQINCQPTEERAFLSTLIWSEKEAVLKALSLGLKMDTRHIQIDLSNDRDSNEWQHNTFTVKNEKNLRLLWRRQNAFVLTVCGENICPADLHQVEL